MTNYLRSESWLQIQMRFGNISVWGRRTRGRRTFGRPLGRQVQRRWITSRPVFNRITETLQLSAYRRSSWAAFVLNSFNTNIGFNIGFIAQQFVFSLSPPGMYVGRAGVLTVFVHARQHAFTEPAGATLIPVRFVHRTRAFRFRFAYILSVASNRSLDK